MHARQRTRAVAASLVGLLLALATRADASRMTMPGVDTADQAMMRDMQRMQQTMRDAPTTGDPDHDFVAMMLPHHQGAVDMAEVELRFGRDPQMRRLARDIIAAQQREIAEMRGWLAAHRAR